MSKKPDKHEVGRAKGSRLARRARSFKEDILGKIHQMRTPSRAASPQQPHKARPRARDSELDAPTTGLASPAGSPSKQGDSQVNNDMKQISNALRYFQDSVEKNTLGHLPGSASIVLEYVLHLISLLKKDLINDQSSVLISTTNQVYQSLSRFIEWADDVMLNRERATMEGVNQVVQSLQDSLKALIEVSQKQSQNKDKSKHMGTTTPNGIYSSKGDSNSHRNSLPELPLTPRERQILESTRIPDNGAATVVSTAVPPKGPLCHSASSDSILSSALRPDFPPPKPPLPHLMPPRSQLGGSSLDTVAPPLPPKKKSGTLSSNSNLLEPLSAALRSPLFGDWQGSSTLSGASSFESCLHHSADDLLGMSSPVAWTATTHKTSYQSFSYNACTTTVSSRSDSVDQLLSHSSSSTHISAMKQVDKTLASVSHQSFELKGSALGTSVDDIKPALPIKQRSARTRTPSQYDNVSDAEDAIDGERWKSEHWHSTHTTDMMGCKVIGHEPSCPQHGQLTNASSTNVSTAAEDGRPPPLPPKKKMIQEYIQTFGSYSQPAEQHDFFNSGRLYTYQAALYKQVQMSFASLGSDEFLGSSLQDATLAAPFELSSPPALPPKKNRSSSLGIQDGLMLPTRQSYASFGSGTCLDTPQPLKAIEDALPDENGESLIDLQDVSDHLIFGDNPNDVRGLKGGPADALIIHATAVPENSEKEYFYQEAFLTTYKTFVSPTDLVNKLIYRYNKFIQFSDTRQKYARWAFSLLVRVVDDLGLSDAGPEMVRCLTAFSHQLVGRGDLSLARALRAKVVEKWEAHAQLHNGGPWSSTGAGGAPSGSAGSLANLRVTTQPATLLQFKSELLAEQMTLLDAHLFQRIDISEILIWAKEQNEDSSPNLTKFTEHFNKMSYWARSSILKQCDAKDRERVVVKFIKIMKHLRKINNFNSYLAILSALDSAPIRRLEWQKNITEGLKEYCALIDSSSSFRAYRQALAETTPPCIPYIGLILQDLTFVHVGNTDYITDSIVNFTKCWQQFHILEPMRCFKKKPFTFKRNEQIIDFFNNFEDYLSEDAMWEISENIKPRAGQKKKDYS
ncbi:guanine nucleotide-releasing factor 2 isoform X1 [Rhipicephalus microplus]|uniref:guanine nucleotide-releasing factor 2 isoform X1 n=1 Tax=Rhipicephalus microplus TaxID=6941 RepID=UPI003F6C1100